MLRKIRSWPRRRRRRPSGFCELLLIFYSFDLSILALLGMDFLVFKLLVAANPKEKAKEKENEKAKEKEKEKEKAKEKEKEKAKEKEKEVDIKEMESQEKGPPDLPFTQLPKISLGPGCFLREWSPDRRRLVYLSLRLSAPQETSGMIETLEITS